MTLKQLFKQLAYVNGRDNVSYDGDTIVVDNELTFNGATIYWIENGLVQSEWCI